jgi:DNA anti-recombination protein RmuC
MEITMITNIIIAGGSVLAAVLSISKLLGKKFDKIDEKFDKIDEKFERLESKMDTRFDRLESKIDARFEKTEFKFDEVNKAIGSLDARLHRIEGYVLKEEITSIVAKEQLKK